MSHNDFHFVVYPSISSLSRTDVCLTEACVVVASSVLSSMDKSIDPCEDFHKYSCGGWYKHHQMPDGSTRWSTFGVLWRENQYVLKNILGEYKCWQYHVCSPVFLQRPSTE